MKNGTILLAGGVLLAAYYFEQLGVAGQTVQIVFAGVQFKSLTTLRILFNIQNVSNATVLIRALTADVMVNGNELGNISYFPTLSDGTIPATGQKQIGVDMEISLISLPSTIRDLITHSGGSLAFNVNGNMNVNALVLPFNLDKTIVLQ